MQNFIFQNPTKIIFGKNTAQSVGQEVSGYSKKILLHYGSGSIKKIGLYDTVIASLKAAGIEFVELSGVQPNPRLSLVQEGIRICRENGIDFILAVGGGSVIDSAKAIAAGAVYTGDVWDFFQGKPVTESLPIGTILTIPAAGSESSHSAVITNEDGGYKRHMEGGVVYPKFSILDPQMCFSLPSYQVACGAADIMAHTMERYFTNEKNVEFTDRLCEATLKTIINNVPKVLENPKDYDSWAEVMWAGTVAHNNLLNTGRIGDWASHGIEHELSGIYDIAHGAGLAIVFPAWMKYVYQHDIVRFVQFAIRVWDIADNGNPEEVAMKGVQELEKFFRKIGLTTTLKEVNISDEKLVEMSSKGTGGGTYTLGNFVKLGQSDVLEILKLAL